MSKEKLRLKPLEKVFSIKNDTDRRHKVITCMGLHLKLKRTMPPKELEPYLKEWYLKVTGNYLDLDNPQTFNEKIQWMKLYDSTPAKTKLADKYLVRNWVKDKIGEEYLIPLLGVWDKFDDIDFNKLPEQFVLKCNHGSGYNIIVTDKAKFNKKEARKKINIWMKEDFAYKFGFELHYSAIPRKIIAEKFLQTPNNDIQDYKFLCFDGKPYYVWVDKNRFTEHKRNIYNLEWNLLDYKINTKYDNFPAGDKPYNYSKMLEFAKVLSKGFAHVRVDFYEWNNQLFFGEMTFTSSSGTEDIYPDKFAYELGKLIPVSNKKL